ncbi:2-oxo-4-hydroxy-4-carboxy-5-ureidoimidazoline decarboxylase [Streptomyces xantholiticus]|uniref:2-oxo-4-hydroxy-4-carboxy-5-ureidoimidazoline decarboxylase n=1 Tax=Streptomyces xantholiticus TaxID=68285 RepID=UPI001673DB91
MTSDSHAGLPKRPPTLHHTRGVAAPSPIPSQRRAESGLEHFNSAPADAAEATVLACCGSRRWARRVVAHRPYPDLGSLFAACDEAGYDLSPGDVHEVLAGESSTGLPPSAPQAAHTALAAAHVAYESRFGHAFVICLDAYRPDEYLDQVLAGIRSRLSHEPDEERAISAEELRALARSRLVHALADHPGTGTGVAGVVT